MSATPQPTPVNSSFSQQAPQLQLGIDSTSLGAFKTCPRFYQLSIIQGWRAKQENVHFAWGGHLHSGRERYEHLRAAGQEHEEALHETLHFVAKATWSGGRPWNSGDTIKNRFTLLRALAAYLDYWNARPEGDPLHTLQLANGRPAIELSFRFDSGYTSRLTGESFLLCGHLDKIGEFQDQHWVSDLKTTGGQLGGWYFETFTPDNQFSLYILAGQVAFGFKTRGLMLDAVQVQQQGDRFERAPVMRSQSQLDEWHDELGFWLESIDRCAERRSWPQNDKACFRCEFRSVCSKSPGSSREAELKANFTKRQWDPLQARGEPS